MELVEVKNNQPVTTSLQVAETFEIEHRNVLRDIRSLSCDVAKNLECSEMSSMDKPMFLEDKYKVSGSKRKYPMYYMNKDGWTLLVMGYKGKKAIQFKLRYMAQFKKMETELKKRTQLAIPQDYATALEQLAYQVRLNESLLLENSQLKQYPNDYEDFTQTELLPNVLYTTEELAEETGYPSAQALNKQMHKERIIYYSKKDRAWCLYAPYANRGLKDMSTRRNSQMWTEKGRIFINVRFQRNI